MGDNQDFIGYPWPETPSSSDRLASGRRLAWSFWDHGEDPGTPTSSGWEEFYLDNSLSEKEAAAQELIDLYMSDLNIPDFFSSDSDSLASGRRLAWTIYDRGEDPKTPTSTDWEEFWSNESQEAETKVKEEKKANT
jgi:hypothetical protein